MQSILEDLKWRYATKKFDPEKKISESELNTILEAIRLAPSSYGLQPTKVMVIKDPEIREKLFDASYGQRQVVDASHLIVLTSFRELHPVIIHSYLDVVAETRQQNREDLKGFENMLINFSQAKDRNHLSEWMKKQNYIVLGHLLQICAQLRIDTTPMEGFNADRYDQILDLEERNLKTDLVIPIGYRDHSDQYLQRKKVRRPFNDIVEFL